MNDRKKAIKPALRSVEKGAAFAQAVYDLWVSLGNHPGWYTLFRNDELINANFGMRESIENPYIMGSTYKKIRVNTAEHLGDRYIAPVASPSSTDRMKAPRDAVIRVHPMLGKLKDENLGSYEDHDPLTEAATIMLNELRAVATTTVNYQVQDFKRYLQGCYVAVILYTMLRRILGLSEIADAYDADAPKKYPLMASGMKSLTPDTLRAALPYIKANFDAVTAMMVNMIPMNVSLLERAKWIYGVVFKDSPTSKFTTKIIVPTDVEYTDENDKTWVYIFSQNGTGADNKFFMEKQVTTDGTFLAVNGYSDMSKFQPYDLQSPADILDALRNHLDIMAKQDKTSRIVGDLLKAFGQKAFMPIPPYKGGRTPFVYDEDMLSQIQNATLLYMSQPLSSPVYPVYDKGKWIGVGYNSGISRDEANGEYLAPGESTALSNYALINTFRERVEPGRALALTRLTALWTIAGGYVGLSKGVESGGLTTPLPNYYLIAAPACAGTEAPICMEYVDNYGARNVNNTTVFGNEQRPGQVIRYMGANASDWASDDYAPRIFSAGQSMLDQQNWAILSWNDLRTFHSLALLSMFTIPFLVDKQTVFDFTH